ncbi:uncharacterized protein LOC119979971 [Tripterygium wilfordii]|uniref:uncharacterized protein LOC119979971 n=1 Tax=Tripterygium wilfordii TaxID=458696 RepID=UPI0018F7F99B|nr:uncharacterized protein LOC119979971 [Tripterygium wilfordii]
MEDRHSLLLRRCSEEQGDMFAILPDDFAYHIIKSLSVEDLLRLSFVSKRCRNLCLSTPNVSINSHNPVTIRGLNYRFGFINSLNRFMDQRHHGRTKICTFNLSWSLSGSSISSEEFFFLKYLNQAVDCSVEEIGLSVIHPPGKPFELPLFVLQCKSLRRLSVNTNGCLLKFPSLYAGFSSVESLSIESVLLDNDFCKDWIPGFFKSIRELEIKSFLGMETISITSNSLESVTISDLRNTGLSHLTIVAEKLQKLNIVWYPPVNTVTSSFKINSPNLVDFRYVGEPVRCYHCLGGLARVDNVVFDLRMPNQLALNPTSHNMRELLQSVGSTRGLNLLGQSLEMFSSMRLGFPILFNNLENLTLTVDGFDDHHVPFVASLLRGTPNLTKLHISSGFSEDILFHMQYWQSQKIMFHQLSILTVSYQKGHNILELVKYLAAHAEKLRVIVIRCLNPILLDSFIDVLRNKKASTTVYFIYYSSVGCESVTCVDASHKSPFSCAKTTYVRTNAPFGFDLSQL